MSCGIKNYMKYVRFVSCKLTWSRRFSPWGFPGPPTECCPLAHPHGKLELPHSTSPPPRSESLWSHLAEPPQAQRAPTLWNLKQAETLHNQPRNSLKSPKVTTGGRHNTAHTILFQTVLGFDIQVGFLVESWQDLRYGHRVVVRVASGARPHCLHGGGTVSYWASHCQQRLK